MAASGRWGGVDQATAPHGDGDDGEEGGGSFRLAYCFLDFIFLVFHFCCGRHNQHTKSISRATPPHGK